jgi:hypothetical protein
MSKPLLVRRMCCNKAAYKAAELSDLAGIVRTSRAFMAYQVGGGDDAETNRPDKFSHRAS